MGKFAIALDKFPIETISMFAATTSGRRARYTIPVKNRCSLPVEIPAYVPVTIPDPFDILTGLKHCGDIFKNGNPAHPSRILNREIIRSLSDYKICNKICTIGICWYEDEEIPAL